MQPPKFRSIKCAPTSIPFHEVDARVMVIAAEIPCRSPFFSTSSIYPGYPFRQQLNISRHVVLKTWSAVGCCASGFCLCPTIISQHQAQNTNKQLSDLLPTNKQCTCIAQSTINYIHCRSCQLEEASFSESPDVIQFNSLPRQSEQLFQEH